MVATVTPLTLTIARLDTQPGDTLVFNVNRRLSDDETKQLHNQVQKAAQAIHGDGAHFGVMLCEDGIELARIVGKAEASKTASDE